jgi:LPS sulfotransferase NodH
MSLHSEKQELRRLHASLERLDVLFARATPESLEVQANRSVSYHRLEKLKAQTNGKKQLVLLCMTPRSGSSLFCEALHKTGKLGDPGEWFNAHDGNNLDNMVREFGAQTREDMLDHIYTSSATDNGVCIVKGDFYQCQPFLYDDLLFRHFDSVRFINIRRKDLLAQAISRYIGTQTGSWASHQEARDNEPRYDREAIQRQLDYMLTMEECWRNYFAVRAMRPPQFTYEQIVRDLPTKVEQVAKMCGLTLKSDVTPNALRLKKQGSDRNAKWAKRFAKETRHMARKHTGLNMKPSDLRKPAQNPPAKRPLETMKHN